MFRAGSSAARQLDPVLACMHACCVSTAGVPVAAADIGGAPELVDEGVEGTLFAPGNVDALVAALDRIDALDGGGQNGGARTAARRRAGSRHDRTDHFDRLEAIIAEALDIQRKAPRP